MRINGVLTDLDSIQITSGDTQLTYEAYIEPKIFVKNDNDIYEQFTDKQEENYSNQERIIGTWIDGKPLYTKVVSYTPTDIIGAKGTETHVYINHNISNFGQLCGIKCYTSDNYIVPTFGLDGNNNFYGLRLRQVGTTAIDMYIINDTWAATRTWYFILKYTKK